MSIAQACPKCGRRLEPATNVCTSCSYDLRQSRRAASGARELLEATASKLGGASRGSQVVRAWIVGIVLCAILVGTMLAALGDNRFTGLYLLVVASYFVVAWLVGMLRDLRYKSLFAAMMWFAPMFGGKALAVIHETAAPRVHHRNPMLEALFINAALALVSVLVFGGIQIARNGLV